MVAAGCGGTTPGRVHREADRDNEHEVESNLEDAGSAVRGGKIVYGLEAETDGGWCLSESTLAISGIQVARTIYDTLTVPNSVGDYTPYLAESFDHNAAYDAWTFKLRKGVTFHDGSRLDAQVVKNNFDAFRGEYPPRTAALFESVFRNLKSVEVVDELTVKFTMFEPWVAFPGFVYSSGRLGIMAQAQLDDEQHCDTKLIGTGPFEAENWVRNSKFVAVANRNYWYDAPDGKPYPYLDEIEYRPIPEGAQRVNALEAGEVQVIHTSSATQVLTLRDAVEAGEANLLESNRFSEVYYLMLNSGKPPFDNVDVRKAIQRGIDRDVLNDTLNDGLPVIADGPFAPGNLGHLDNTEWPEVDVGKAKKAIEDYKGASGGEVRFTLTTGSDPENVKTVELIQSLASDIGIDVDVETVSQAQLIALAAAGDYQAALFRNHPGGDPDTQYVWWHSDSFVNFGRIDDPEIDRLLDAGRVETDPGKREQVYEDLNLRFTQEAWNIWLWYSPWAIGLDEDVHGALGPDLPDGSSPYPGLATGHSVLGLWTEAG